MSDNSNLPEPATQLITHGLPSEAGTAVVPLRPARRASGWDLLISGTVNKICLGIVALYLLVGLVSILAAFDQLIRYKYDAEHPYNPPALGYVDAAGVRHISPAAWLGFDFQG